MVRRSVFILTLAFLALCTATHAQAQDVATDGFTTTQHQELIETLVAYLASEDPRVDPDLTRAYFEQHPETSWPIDLDGDGSDEAICQPGFGIGADGTALNPRWMAPNIEMLALAWHEQGWDIVWHDAALTLDVDEETDVTGWRRIHTRSASGALQCVNVYAYDADQERYVSIQSIRIDPSKK